MFKKATCVLLFALSIFFPWLIKAQPVDLVVQTGHNGIVYGVAYSKDGRYAASACVDGAVKLWDAKLGFEIFTFYDFDQSAQSVTFSPDGNYLLGTGSSGNILWDLKTGKKIARVFTEEDEDMYGQKGVEGLTLYSNNNKYCFSAISNIQRWDVNEMIYPDRYPLKDGERAVNEDGLAELDPLVSSLIFQGHTAGVTGMAITNDDKYLVSVSEDSTIRIWDVETGREIRKIKNKFALSAIAISKDGKKIYTAEKDISANAGLRCWDFTTGKQLFILPNSNGYRNAISVSPDGKWLLTGTLLGKIEIYKLPELKLIRSFTGHSSWITSVQFSGDGRFFVSGGDDDAVKIWEFASLRLVKDLRKTIANIDKLVYDNKHQLLTTTSSNERTQQSITWETEHGIGLKNAWVTRKHFYNDQYISIDSAGKSFVMTEDSTILFFNATEAKLLKKVSVPFVGTTVLSPAGDYVLFQHGKTDNLMRMDAKDSVPIFFAEYPDKDTTRFLKGLDVFDFSPDAKFIAASGVGPDIFIWDITGRYIRNLNYLDADSSERKEGTYADNESLAFPNAQVNDLKFSPDGKLIAAAVRMPDPVATGGIIIIWELATGRLLHWISAHNYIIQSIGWSPDGNYIVTGSNDKWMKVWRFADFKGDTPDPVFLYRHDFTPIHTSFTKDNKWLVTGAIDGKITIRNPANYKTIVTLIGLDKNDYVVVTTEKYYAASKKGLQYIAFRQGNKVFPAEQFDIRFNRPDKVLEAIGSSDSELIQSYRQAYFKRIKKLQIDTLLFRDDLSAPDLEIYKKDSIAYGQSQQTIKLRLLASDSLYNLDRFNVWVNEVPLFGQRGIRYAGKNNLDTVIVFSLSEGENRIESSVINSNGTESFRSPLLVHYQPPAKAKPKLYFIGIGIDDFADKKFNLEYSTKDIIDLSRKLKSKFGSDILIDTLFNANVTVGNIRRLKQKLKTSGVDDKVIVSYSGHGLLNKNLDYFLSTYNINFEKPEENGLPYDELENLLDSIPARRKLLLIDACHSGEVDKEDLVALDSMVKDLHLIKGLKPVGYKNEKGLGLKNSFELMQSLFVNVGKTTGATIISAAAGTQFALERNDLRNGVFTYCILEALEKNKTMKVSALRNYVSQRVFQLTNGMQQPTSRNEMISVDWDLW